MLQRTRPCSLSDTAVISNTWVGIRFNFLSVCVTVFRFHRFSGTVLIQLVQYLRSSSDGWCKKLIKENYMSLLMFTNKKFSSNLSFPFRNNEHIHTSGPKQFMWKF
jgi:hypothetical protein